MKPWHPQLSFKWPCTQGESVDSGRWSANGHGYLVKKCFLQFQNKRGRAGFYIPLGRKNTLIRKCLAQDIRHAHSLWKSHISRSVRCCSRCALLLRGGSWRELVSRGSLHYSNQVYYKTCTKQRRFVLQKKANETSMWLEEWNELKGCFKVTVFSSLKGWFCYRDQKNKKSFVTNSTNFNLKLRFTSPVFQ